MTTLARAISAEHPTILFDGVCNFCNGSVNFILARDPRKTFRFAPLQGPTGRRVLAALGLSADELETMILVIGSGHYTRSTAALQIARRLRFPWPLLAVLLIVPACLRDIGYRVLARNRYRWFGKREVCMVPSPEIRWRFLD